MSLSTFTRRLRRSRGRSPLSASEDRGDGASETSSELNSPVINTIDIGDDAHLDLDIPRPEGSARTVIPASARVSYVTDRALADIRPLRAQINAGPPGIRPRHSAVFEKRIGRLATLATTAVEKVVEGLKDADAEESELAEKIKRGIERFTDNIPWLMKALDEVAKIHPAVTVAVLAFEAVYYLESTRRANDRRVMTLYVMMKDMMMVLVQLKDIESTRHRGLDGEALEDRLERLSNKTAENIKACANVCDTFLKKRPIVRVFKGPLWADRLGEFVEIFAQRKGDFEFALAMHTATGVTEIKRQNYEIGAKLETVVALLTTFASCDELKIQQAIHNAGGFKNARKDDAVLKSLLALDASLRSDGKDDEKSRPPLRHSQATQGAGQRENGDKTKSGQKKGLSMDTLEEELLESLDESLERNLQTFMGKFDLQVATLRDALERYIRVENDRVIDAVTEAMALGPHMRVRDLNWRGSVKARTFVLILQEHYRELSENAIPLADANSTDSWALKYLTVSWLRPIMEAFDEDASGHVTITEVNRVMELRPPVLKWSFPHWMAYWAVGCRLATIEYIQKIKTLFVEIADLSRAVLAVNRQNASMYMADWWWIAQLVRGFEDNVATSSDPALLDRFRDMVDFEEHSLRENLTKVKYHIDASDTLSLVLGKRSFEKSVFALLYLLLEYDCKKFYAARVVSFTHREWTRSFDSLSQVYNAVSNRYSDLQSLFGQRNRTDLKAEFYEHAFGMYTHLHDPSAFWSFENSEVSKWLQLAPLQFDAVCDLDAYEEEEEFPYDSRLYDIIDTQTELDTSAPSPLDAIVGEWNGFCHDEVAYPSRPMISFHFHVAGQGPIDDDDIDSKSTTSEDSSDEGDEQDDTAQPFVGSGIDFDSDNFEVTGFCKFSDDGTVRVEWKVSYKSDLKIFYIGRLVDECTIEGDAAYNNRCDIDRKFILKKAPADVVIFRPFPAKLQPEAPGRYPALWAYAISATLSVVRRRQWSWSYFAARRDVRRRFLEIDRQRYQTRAPFTREDLAQVHRSCTAADALFYETIGDYIATTGMFNGVEDCATGNQDAHPHETSGSRFLCLDCAPNDEFQLWVSICDRNECLRQTIDIRAWKGIPPRIPLVHRPTHDLVKVRTMVHNYTWQRLKLSALSVLQQLRSGALMGPPARPPSSFPSISPSDIVNEDGEKPSSLAFPSHQPPEYFEGPRPEFWRCRICAQDVFMGDCWYCMICSDYVCDNCEANSLIRCQECSKPFPQPTWYYGHEFDDFLCVMCSARGFTGSDLSLDDQHPHRHVYTHPLVRCKQRDADPVLPMTPFESGPLVNPTDRFAELEKRLSAMDEKFDVMNDRFASLQTKLERMEAQMEQSRQAMQDTLVARFAHVLSETLAGMAPGGRKTEEANEIDISDV
ncbi:uncharacterized protein BXZ73DRAFT_104877 [Epithele typhae]|uniref:uncharacterized protein n=1 Tax=Epithele typhae TaxID=378194 RepID=UPI0020087B17|nr:uncharacterized protein BXZ73DRAFT_104877 [Epithele typhae]KAH9919769.1 hypothetical protein BXZ73DRAFT_104877 [Epithele typhae]